MSLTTTRGPRLPQGTHAIAPAFGGDWNHQPMTHAGFHEPLVRGGWFGGAFGVWPAHTIVINNTQNNGTGGGGTTPGTGTQGVTDGSPAAAGQVGEIRYFSNSSDVSLVTAGNWMSAVILTCPLPAGVWLIYGTVMFDCQTSGAARLEYFLSTSATPSNMQEGQPLQAGFVDGTHMRYDAETLPNYYYQNTPMGQTVQNIGAATTYYVHGFARNDVNELGAVADAELWAYRIR